MEPIENPKTKETQPKPVEEDKTLEERVVVLEAKIAALEPKVIDVAEAVKVTKTPLQLIVEKEGNEYKARRKVLIKTATETKEGWEDVTDTFTQQELEDKLYGA